MAYPFWLPLCAERYSDNEMIEYVTMRKLKVDYYVNNDFYISIATAIDFNFSQCGSDQNKNGS